MILKLVSETDKEERERERENTIGVIISSPKVMNYIMSNNEVYKMNTIWTLKLYLRQWGGTNKTMYSFLTEQK